ncbi:hypothetical protein B0J17DRAFT_768999 [Rhizoctonia solani]|nr:hypothetical protein B0J17DRAFT_768999 [Rhizoctonia solani]
MFSYAFTVLKTVVPVAWISGAVATVENTIRRSWAGDEVQHKLDKNDGEPGRLSSAYTVGVAGKSSTSSNPHHREFNDKPRKPKASKVSLGPPPEVPAHRGTKITVNAYSYENADAAAPAIKVNTRQSAARKSRSMSEWDMSIIPEPIKLANLASNIQALKATKSNVRYARPQVAGLCCLPLGPRRRRRSSVQRLCGVLPRPSSGPLRASESAPARLSCMKTPSQARRILPAKRLSKTPDSVEPTNVKRGRVFHPNVSPVQNLPTPPCGSLAALFIPSQIADSPHPLSIRSSDSIMSLSELVHDRPPKRVRPTPDSPGPAPGHELSSSGKPGALAHVPSLKHGSTTSEDIEMVVLDTMETSEVKMSSLELRNLDEWMPSAPPTSTMDEETKALFDDDVEMEEREWREDRMMWGGYRGQDETMQDWTDEDVVMGGVT